MAKLPNWLRWVLLLPAAMVAALALFMVYGLVLSWFSACVKTDFLSLEGNFFSVLLYVAALLAFFATLFMVAPTHKKTVVTMGVLLALCNSINDFTKYKTNPLFPITTSLVALVIWTYIYTIRNDQS